MGEGGLDSAGRGDSGGIGDCRSDGHLGKHADEVAKSDKKFSTLMVIACCAAVIAYFALYFAFKWFHPTGTWDTALTAAWFAYWGAELVMLASIRKSKIKNKYEKE